MPKFLINTTKNTDHQGQPIGRALEVPKLGLKFFPGRPIEVSDEQLAEIEANPVTAAWMRAGDLVEWHEPAALATAREEAEAEGEPAKA